MRLIAIDPGANGAFAVYTQESEKPLQTLRMPDGMTNIVATIRALRDGTHQTSVAYCEKVGGYMPGNSGPAAVKFARHCGVLETALYCCAIPTMMVTPSKWMQHLGTMPQDKQERKRFIKEQMQRRFPDIGVTLVNADALGILVYAAAQKGIAL